MGQPRRDSGDPSRSQPEPFVSRCLYRIAHFTSKGSLRPLLGQVLKLDAALGSDVMTITKCSISGGLDRPTPTPAS